MWSLNRAFWKQLAVFAVAGLKSWLLANKTPVICFLQNQERNHRQASKGTDCGQTEGGGEPFATEKRCCERLDLDAAQGPRRTTRITTTTNLHLGFTSLRFASPLSFPKIAQGLLNLLSFKLVINLCLNLLLGHKPEQDIHSRNLPTLVGPLIATRARSGD
mmetsp:Transcript_80972/g.169034  ORF Transcript_80972/g.169034 Transcript_80972/m.169034 type:complete len:161 (+) Transcript_80972:246-728(+)